MKTIESCYPTPDGKYIITGAMEGAIRVSESSTGNPVKYFRGFKGTYAEYFLMDKDGKYLFCAPFKGQLAKWDFVSGKMLWKRDYFGKAFITSVAISDDSKYLFLGSRIKSKVISSDTGKEIVTIFHASNDINFAEAAAFSPDSKYLFICFTPGLLEVREVGTYNVVATLYEVSTFGVGNGEFYVFSLSNFQFNVFKILNY